MAAKKKQAPPLVDERLLSALTHRTRVHALSVLNQRVASPKELAEELGEDVSAVGHHIKELRELGLIELVEEKRRRGATEHFYRATVRQFLDGRAWKQVPEKDRPAITVEILRLISGDLSRAMVAGTIDEMDDNHLSRTPLILDTEGWGESVSLLEDTLNGLFVIHEKSAERLTESGEEGMPVKVAILHFKSPGRKGK